MIYVTAPRSYATAFGAGFARFASGRLSRTREPLSLATLRHTAYGKPSLVPRVLCRRLLLGGSPFLRCPPSFAPLSSLRSSITPLRYGAPLRGAPQLCASVQLYGSARSVTFVVSRSLRSLAFGRVAPSPPQLRPCSRLLCRRKQLPHFVGKVSPNPRLPQGEGAQLQRDPRFLVPRSDQSLALLDIRLRLRLPSQTKQAFCIVDSVAKKEASPFPFFSASCN